MGNIIDTVHAAEPQYNSAPLPPITPAPPTSPIPNLPPPGTASPPAPSVKTELEIPEVTNPGSYEELFGKVRMLQPMLFDGLRMCMSKGLSGNFQVSHTVQLSNKDDGGCSYKFSPTYIGGQADKPQEANPVILGETDMNGGLTAQVIYNWLSNTKSKLVVSSTKDQIQMYQGDVEWRAPHSTATLTLGNINVLTESGAVVGHYLQRLTPHLDLGCEYVYQYGPQTVHNVTVAARYNAPSWNVIGAASLMGTHLAYFHKANENIKAGVEWEYNIMRNPQEPSKVSLSYQVDVPKFNVTFRAMADTNWTVGSVLEKRLEGLPFAIGLSSMLNHNRNTVRLGVSLTVG